MTAPFTIWTPRLFDGRRMRGATRVHVADGRVAGLESGDGAADTRLPAGAVLVPGFVDAQVNGGGGVLFNDAPHVEALRAIAAAHARFGTTAILPTLITDADAVLERAVAAVADAIRRGVPGIAGIHLEGPFLSPRRPGVHPPRHIRPMREADIARLSALGRRGRTLVTLAPEEVPDELIAALRRRGVLVSAGHSEASEARMAEAVAAGVSLTTHLYNAMSQLSPREGGLVGATLADPRLVAGLIADGLHVSPAALRAAILAKGRRGLMLVSDAMPTVGTVLDSFDLLGTRVWRRGDRLTTEAGTLAGAHLTMAGAIRHVASLGVPLTDALAMATSTPARALRLGRTLGAIAPGRRADLVALDDALDVRAVWIAGTPVDGVGPSTGR
jgi:N-acetylglucosamine-6-phosphate deacetylase